MIESVIILSSVILAIGAVLAAFVWGARSRQPDKDRSADIVLAMLPHMIQLSRDAVNAQLAKADPQHSGRALVTSNALRDFSESEPPRPMQVVSPLHDTAPNEGQGGDYMLDVVGSPRGETDTARSFNSIEELFEAIPLKAPEKDE